MNCYDVTVIYAVHDLDCKEPPAFPGQTLPAEKIQVIPVTEPDICHPRRNSLAAIARAEGRFTILLDAGDQFPVSFLEKLMAAFEPDSAFVMPSSTFSLMKNKMNVERFSLETSANVRIDTSTKADLFPTELHGLLFPTATLKDALEHIQGTQCILCPSGEETKKPPLSWEPEKQVLLYLLTDRTAFQYLGDCSLQYVFPREFNFEYDYRCHTYDWYYKPFTEFLLLWFANTAGGARNEFLAQNMALYMLNIRIFSNTDNRNKHVIPPEEVGAYCEVLSDVLQHIDVRTILTASEAHTTMMASRYKLLYLRLKKRDFSYYPSFRCAKNALYLTADDEIFCDLTVLALRVIQLDYENGHLEIDGEYSNYFAEDAAEVFARFDRKDYKLRYNGRYSRTKCFGVTFSNRRTFHVSIPVPASDKNRLLNFIIKVGQKEYVMEYAFPSHSSRFAKDFGYAYWRFEDYLAYWQKDGIHVVKSKKLLVLKKEVALWLQMWKKKNGFYRDQLPIKILNFLLSPYFSRRKIWLFMDKIYKGGDSSEYMYRYALKKKDGIKKYYLLDKTSADYARMVKEGYKPLVRGSLKHRLVFLNADMVIASNSTVFAFNDYSFERSLPIRGVVHFDVACVQHGMSVQKIAIAQQRLRDNTRLYFCASKYEIENLSKPVYDYVGYDALKLTGVPRYDGLVNRAEKIIVISPTWRMQSAIPVSKSESFARDYNPNFKETEYYRVYNGLINDPRLLDAARKYGYRIQYVLHPIVSPQHDDFTKNDVVEIIPSIGDMSYEKIFCEGALMVTDFSGVQFDFAYMRKPVIYLHHKDIPQHYEEGSFHYDTMGFGEICRTNEELIDVLCDYMEKGCVMPELYRKRADDFFEFSDNRNCERIYPVMVEHERARK